eukprot:scaffold58164_cov43-Cyclotella_meneghiniana.AAC.1
MACSAFAFCCLPLLEEVGRSNRDLLRVHHGLVSCGRLQRTATHWSATCLAICCGDCNGLATLGNRWNVLTSLNHTKNYKNNTPTLQTIIRQLTVGEKARFPSNAPPQLKAIAFTAYEDLESNKDSPTYLSIFLHEADFTGEAFGATAGSDTSVETKKSKSSKSNSNNRNKSNT